MADNTQATQTSNQNQKVVEKYYIEVSPSAKKRFLIGLAGGIGWGVGLTLGTAVLLYIISFAASQIDFVPFIGKFAAEVIKSAQENLSTR